MFQALAPITATALGIAVLGESVTANFLVGLTAVMVALTRLWARSRALCEAAVLQVADDASRRDFRQAVPRPRHRLWAGLLAVPALAALGLVVAFPAAATNAWARFLAPWKSTLYSIWPTGS